jgi:hypothetical protein
VGCVSKFGCQAPLQSCRHTLTYRLAFGQLSEGTHQSPSSIATATVKFIMSDPKVATKAPESDAAEERESEASLIPGDTPAQSGASLGVSWSSLECLRIANLSQEHCVTDRPTRQYFQNLFTREQGSTTACVDLIQLLERDQVEN